jgi:hypothetical protein
VLYRDVCGECAAVNFDHLMDYQCDWDTDKIEYEYTKNPYVEFRHIGGKDYHKKYDDIVEDINMFVDATIASVDGNTRPQKVVHKINKIARG